MVLKKEEPAMRDHRIAVGVSLEGKIRSHGFFLTQIIAMLLPRPSGSIQRDAATMAEGGMG